MPAATVKQLAAGAAGQPLTAAAIGGPQTAAGAMGDPGRRLHGHGVTVAQAHLELALAAVDPFHPLTETGPMHLANAEHPINPGMDHFVAEGAEGGLPGQRIQQRPRQHDLAQAGAIGPSAMPVKAGGAGESPVTPAQIDDGTVPLHQPPVKVLPVQPVKQGQQRFQGHRAGSVSARIMAPSARRGRRSDSQR